jgi:hypothetical protein
VRERHHIILSVHRNALAKPRHVVPYWRRRLNKRLPARPGKSR